MKLNSWALGIIVVVLIFGGIGLTMAFNLWQTEGSRNPARYNTGEYAGEANPADIRGSYSFQDINDTWDVPVGTLAGAFGLSGLDSLTHAVVWSMVFNIGFYILGSLFFEPGREESQLADSFVDVLDPIASASSLVAGEATVNLAAKMEIVKPLIVGELSYKGKVVMGQVAGDLHTIGRKFVNMMLESAGFEVVDLGEDVPAERFIEVVKKEQSDILGLSALLTTTMLAMKEVVEAFENSNLRDKVKIVVGGAPVSQSFADTIGADGYAPDAITAVDKAKEFIGN